MTLRPSFLATFCTILCFSQSTFARIDRRHVVSQFNIVRTTINTNRTTPLQVGNGNFAFNADITGLQSILPYNIMSSWGWHNDALPANGELPSDFRGLNRVTYGRNTSYDIPDPALQQASQWLIANPNRINLGRIALTYNGLDLPAASLTDTRQELDLWSGVLTSTFKIDGSDVRVITQADFEEDSVAFAIESELVKTGKLAVGLDFPYPPIHTVAYKYEVFAGVYDFPLNHTTKIESDADHKSTTHIHHQLQETEYYVNLRWPRDLCLKLSRNEPANSTKVTAHRYTLKPDISSRSSQLTFTAHFSPEKTSPTLPSVISKRNKRTWNQYWEQGGFVDLTASSNPNATELQRRLINSQYHVRVNSAAKGQPPQESGLMNNGWYGKFHMEMVVWHNAHWIVWGKQQYFDNIFPELYESLLPSSLARAQKMGWVGARWPTMTELATGGNSPGDINAQLLWQQPHPIYLLDLAYRSAPSIKLLKRWSRVITATADYLASYPGLNAKTGLYDLGPPSWGVTENTPPNSTLNLAYEIAYWRYALDKAIHFQTLLNAPVPEKWRHVAVNLAPPPQVDGLYVVYEGLNSSWWDDPALNRDPRSVVMMQGVLPPTPAVDPAVALRTADKLAEEWTDDKIRGWGRPVLAINSARIGRAERAIRHLTAYDYWKFDDAGFAIRGGDGGTPPPFLPGNAGFLFAVGYMAAGWEGSEGDAPGFPKNDGWVVKHEGLRKAP